MVFRVLAVAYREMNLQGAYKTSDETNLILAGFLAFADPPLADAGDMVKELKRSGVTLKIITGDNDLVACHLYQQVGVDDGHEFQLLALSVIGMGFAAAGFISPIVGTILQVIDILAIINLLRLIWEIRLSWIYLKNLAQNKT